MQPKSILKWSNRFSALALLAALLASLVQVRPVYAASIVVNSSEDTDTVNVNDGKCTLREAITAANSDLPRGGCIAGSAGVDNISFAANYTITIGSQLPFITKAVTITGRGAANTIIQAAGTPNTVGWRVFQVTGTGNLTMDGVTVQNGKCDNTCTTVGGVEANAGGGIHNSGTLTVKNSTFKGNRGTLGGAIYNFHTATATIENSTILENESFRIDSGEDGGGAIYNAGTMTILDSLISNNIAAKNGGAIFNSSDGNLTITNNTTISNNEGVSGGGIFNSGGTMTVTGSTISQNVSANTVDDDGGGGIRNGGSLTATNTTFSGNSAKGGGGILNYGTLILKDSLLTGNTGGFGAGMLSGICVNYVCSTDSATIINTVFSGNTVTNSSGAIYNNPGSTLKIQDSTFLNNTSAMFAGAIGNDNGPMEISGSIFSGNTAQQWWGGAIDNFNFFSTPTNVATVTNSTFYGNSAVQGGSIQIRDGSSIVVTNSTFADNTGSGIYNSDSTVTLINTIVSNSTSGGNCSGTITDGGNNLDSGNTCGWGTSNGSMSNTDPMLGALYNNGGHTKTMALLPGSPAIDAGNDAACPATDQRGGARPQGSHCDIGAYESGAPVTFYSVFSDVPPNYWALTYIDRLYEAGITGGCSTTSFKYCPGAVVTRDQMAVFLLRGIHDSSYSPPAVGGSTGFGDVPTNYWAAAWIKQLAVEAITGGCGSGNYCPTGAVTRDQMAVFLLKAKYGSSYSPPALGGSTGFTDVPTTHWAAAWIKQLAAEGITGGCGAGTFCPGSPVTRDQMAVFLVRTFNLP